MVVCYVITHAGEGDRGKKIPFYQVGGKSANDYAEEAAHVLDNEDMRQQGAGDADVGAWHVGSHVIEVVGHPWHPDPLRFRVRCEVIRRYEATKV